MTRAPVPVPAWLRGLAFATALLCCTGARADWTVRIHRPADATTPATATLVHPDSGDASPAALARVLAGHVATPGAPAPRTMVAHGLAGSDAFQAELAAALRRSAPSEFAQALASAGNMHNPRMVPLRAHVEREVLRTPTVQALAPVLASHGLGFGRAGVEKLVLQGPPDAPRLSFMLFITIEPTPEPGEPPHLP